MRFWSSRAVFAFALLCLLVTVSAQAQTGTRHPVDLAVGPDGKTRILWGGSDNSVQLWTVNSSGVIENNFYYAPPSTVWTLTALAMGASDNSARVLWRNADTSASIWTVNTQGQIPQNLFFGPFPGYNAATALAVGADNTAHLIWPSTSNGCALWTLTPTGTQTGNYGYGPYDGWTATSVSVGPDTVRRLLWTHTSGQINLWNVNAQGVALSGSTYGPFDGWTALRVVTASDNTSCILWKHTSGLYAIWKVDAGNNFVSQGNYGPYAGWSIDALALAAGSSLRVLWDDGSGQVVVWTVDGTWNVTSGIDFGPGSGAVNLAAPTNLVATSGSGRVSLTWAASMGATGYAIYRSPHSGGNGYVRLGTASATAYTDSTAVGGLTYYYVVTATKTGGESANSNEASATPRLAPPSGLTGIAASTSEIDLSWTAPAGTVTGYKLERSPNGTTGWTPIGTPTPAAYPDTGLTAGTAYFYRVRATNAAGDSDPSSIAVAVTVPAKPLSLSATPGNAQVTLSWPSVTGAVTYNLYRGTTSGGEGATPYKTGLTTTGCLDTGLTNGTTYFYQVSAVNAGGEGARSDEANAKPLAPDFTLSSSPTSLSVAQGASGQSAVTVMPAGGFTDSVALSAPGLPAGVTAAFSPASVTGSGSSTLTLSVAKSVAVGSYPFTLQGDSGPLSHATAFTLTVTAGINQAPTVSAGTNQTVTLPNTVSLSGTSGDDGLPNPPSTLTTTWSQVSGPGTTTFGNIHALVTTAGFSATGAYVLRLSASDSALTSTSDVTVTVNAAPDFTLSSSPTSLTVTQGSSGQSNISVIPSGGFTGGVTLSASGLPAGVTSTFGTNPATSASTLTLTASSTASTGTATITVSGSPDSPAHHTTISLTVNSMSVPVPTDLIASAVSESQINLSWKAPAGTVDSYNIYRGTAAAAEDATPYQSGVSGLGYQDTGLSTGTTYYYQVTANNAGRESDRSNESCATPSAVGVGFQLTAALINGHVSLAWVGSGDFDVKRSTVKGGPYQILNTVSQTGYTDATVSQGTTYYYVVSVTGSGQNSNDVAVTPSAASQSLFVNSGGDRYTNRYLQVWSEDEDFTGGREVTTTGAISGTADQALYQSQRVGASFNYSLPVANGQYTLGLYFVETQALAAGQRVFNVTANGQPLLTNFDIYADGGGGEAVPKVFSITVANGRLDLTFTGVTGEATVAALSIQPPLGSVIDISPPDWAADAVPFDAPDADGAGPSSSEGVSLPTGVKENSPGADVWARNPIGPDASYERLYRSALAAQGKSSPGLSLGWADNYQFTVSANTLGTWGTLTFEYPSGAKEVWTPALNNGTPTGAFTLPGGTPYLVTGIPSGDMGRWQSFTVTMKDYTRYTFTPDPTGSTALYWLSTITNLVGHGIAINRDSGDRLTTVVNDASPAATLLSFSYNGNALSSVQGVSGRQVTYTFGPAPGIPSTLVLTGVSQLNSSAPRWQYDYAPINNVPFLSSVLSPDPSDPTGTRLVGSTTVYDATGHVSALQDAAGRQRVYSYANGHVSLQVFNAGVDPAAVGSKPDLQWTQNFASGQRNVDTGTTDAANSSSLLEYGDAQNPYRPTRATNRNNQSVQVSYDQYGNALQAVDARQVATTYTYNYTQFPLGQVTQISVSSPVNSPYSPPHLTPSSFLYYGPADGPLNGLIKSVSTPAPDVAGYSQGAPQVVTTTYTYDSLGNVKTVTSPGPNGNTLTTFNYGANEALGEPVSVTVSGPDTAGQTTSATVSYHYDGRGNRTAAIDALNYETDFAYNDADQLTQETYPGGVSTRYTYLYVGGPVTAVAVYDENSVRMREVDYAYGTEGELLSVSGDTEPATYDYDGLYRLSHLTDGNGHKTEYQYDVVGNLAKVLYPGGDSLQYPSYDPDGNLLTKIDGNGVETDYTYADPESLLTKVHYPAGQLADVTFGYDGYGRRATMTDGTGSKTYFLDDLGELLDTTINFTGGPQNQRLYYSHNPDGSRSTMITPAFPDLEGNLSSFSYGYDGLGRLTSAGFPWLPYSYSYYANGWLWSATAGNDSFTLAPTDTGYSYNGRGQLTELRNTTGYWGRDAYSPLSTFSGMTYDAVGNRKTETALIPPASNYENTGTAPDASRTITYTYDTRNELTGEQSVRSGSGADPYGLNYSYGFGYDNAFNPTTFKGAATGGANANNQLLASGFGYDGNGNPTTYEGKAFTFDPENRLTQIPERLSVGYDGDGLRAWKADGSGTKTFFVYDGDQPVVEEDAQGNVVAANGFGADGLRTRYYPGNLVSDYYTYDPQGSLVQRVRLIPGVSPLSPQPGANDHFVGVLDTASFDAFGARHGDIDAGTGGPEEFLDPVGFGGQWGYYTDPETRMPLMTNRYYDAGVGRFLTRDPIGYKGGVNLYGFVGNNPVNETDPSGLRPLNATDKSRFSKLRGAAYGNNSDLRTKDVAPLIEGAIGDLKKQISAVKGATDPINLRVLWFAIDHLGDTDYGAGSALGKGSAFADLGLENESKCNVFVADAYASVVGFGSSGVPLYGKNPFRRYPAGANILGDIKETVPNFSPAWPPQSGDIAGFKEPGGGGHGHSALVIGNNILIYAGGPAIKIGTYMANQKGHDPVVYRRYRP